jgi:hypothetical protein
MAERSQKFLRLRLAERRSGAAEEFRFDIRVGQK